MTSYKLMLAYEDSLHRHDDIHVEGDVVLTNVSAIENVIYIKFAKKENAPIRRVSEENECCSEVMVMLDRTDWEIAKSRAEEIGHDLVDVVYSLGSAMQTMRQVIDRLGKAEVQRWIEEVRGD